MAKNPSRRKRRSRRRRLRKWMVLSGLGLMGGGLVGALLFAALRTSAPPRPAHDEGETRLAAPVESTRPLPRTAPTPQGWSRKVFTSFEGANSGADEPPSIDNALHARAVELGLLMETLGGEDRAWLAILPAVTRLLSRSRERRYPLPLDLIEDRTDLGLSTRVRHLIRVVDRGTESTPHPESDIVACLEVQKQIREGPESFAAEKAQLYVLFLAEEILEVGNQGSEPSDAQENWRESKAARIRDQILDLAPRLRAGCYGPLTDPDADTTEVWFLIARTIEFLSAQSAAAHEAYVRDRSHEANALAEVFMARRTSALSPIVLAFEELRVLFETLEEKIGLALPLEEIHRLSGLLDVTSKPALMLKIVLIRVWLRHSLVRLKEKIDAFEILKPWTLPACLSAGRQFMFAAETLCRDIPPGLDLEDWHSFYTSASRGFSHLEQLHDRHSSMLPGEFINGIRKIEMILEVHGARDSGDAEARDGTNPDGGNGDVGSLLARSIRMAARAHVRELLMDPRPITAADLIALDEAFIGLAPAHPETIELLRRARRQILQLVERVGSGDPDAPAVRERLARLERIRRQAGESGERGKEEGAPAGAP